MKAVTPIARAPGVTFGYLIAAGYALMLWLGVGVLLLPVMLVSAILHRAMAAAERPVVDSHHRWLARHHAMSTLALVTVVVLPLLAIPDLIRTIETALNTWAYAPHPWATLRAAEPQLGLGEFGAYALIAVIGWSAVSLWIGVRVVVGWLRWAERRPA